MHLARELHPEADDGADDDGEVELVPVVGEVVEMIRAYLERRLRQKHERKRVIEVPERKQGARTKNARQKCGWRE